MGNRDEQVCAMAPEHGHAQPTWYSLLVTLLLGAGMLVGCSNDREARDIDRMLSRAATAVEVARSEETKRYAAPELAAAEERLVRARRAAFEKEFVEADRLISESLVNLNLATAKAEAARIRDQVNELKASQTGASKVGPR